MLMFVEFDLSRLPETVSVYSVVRRTVWQIVDPNTLLIYAAEGQCTVTVENTEYRLKEGSLLIVPAGFHYIRRPVGSEFCVLYYAHIKIEETVLDDSEAVRRIAERKMSCTKSPDGSEPASKNNLYISALMTDMHDEKDSTLSFYKEAMAVRLKNSYDSHTAESILIMKLLLKAAHSAYNSVKTTESDDSAPIRNVNTKLQKVSAYIRLHSKENITLDDLCSVCNFSKQHLIRTFHTEFGMSPISYINQYRINAAKELFYRDPRVSVKEVADEMGFSDQHYFSRLFTRVSGVTPTAYKLHLITFDQSKQ